jgi:hypothetical protein
MPPGRSVAHYGSSYCVLLALQFFTGLYLFVLPDVAKWPTARRTN